ncbi:reverse transcriptase [Senna tora]|uniref:Reverse transcriptase n=1 Tax=Senna tora TaxID=362788 RepID=A0A834TIX1_9FABA|nr:reverse transcriptase [Senna tora]
MQVLPLPVGTCDLIDKAIRDFLWHSSQNSKGKIHLIGWDKICNSMREGGLAIIRSEERNLAFLGKLFWRMHHENNSAWAKICHHKFTIFASSTYHKSLIGKSLIRGSRVFNLGMCMVPNSGLKSSFCWDNWTQFEPIRGMIEEPLNLQKSKLLVSDIAPSPGNVEIPSSHPCFPLINACRLLVARLQHISLSHHFRKANSCADLLAKKAVISKSDYCTFNSPPSFVSLALQVGLLGIGVPRRIGIG